MTPRAEHARNHQPMHLHMTVPCVLCARCSGHSPAPPTLCSFLTRWSLEAAAAMASRAGATFGGSRSRLKKSKEIGSFVTSKIIELHFQDRIFGSQVVDPYPIWVCLKIGYSNPYQNMPIFHGLSSFFPIKTCNQLGQRSHLQTLPNIYDLPWRMFCSTGLGRSAAAGAVAGRVGTGTPATYRTLVAASAGLWEKLSSLLRKTEKRCADLYIYVFTIMCGTYTQIRDYTCISTHIHTHTHIYIHTYTNIYRLFPSKSLSHC